MIEQLQQHGFWRRPSLPRRRGVGHREWIHVCVTADDLTLIVNASITDDLRPAAAPGRERMRLVVLARSRGTWHGDVDELDPGDADVAAGRLSARLGEVRIDRDGGALTLRGRLRGQPIGFDLALTPTTVPSVAHNVALGDGRPINWCVVPALAASGTVTVAGREHVLAAAPAYHDHNWGHFDQQDVLWHWGHAHGGDVTTVVSCLFDRARTTTFLQTLMLWRGPRLQRIFRGAELTFVPRGFIRRARRLTVPRSAALLIDGDATEVPRTLEVHAHQDGDELRGQFDSEDLARIVVPDDASGSAVVIHEVVGRLRLAGTVAGAPVALDAPAIFEFLRGVR